MSSKFRRLAARGRVAASIPAMVVAIAAGAAITIAGCGSSGSSGGDHKPAQAAISKSELAQLKGVVADAQKAPAWHAPGPPVDAVKALTGKTIVTFPISSEIDACNARGQQGYLDAEARALGAKVIALQSNTGPAGWQSNLSQAVTAHADAVVMLCGPTAAAIAPQLATLKAHHIAVVNGNYNQTGGNPAFPSTNIDAMSGVDTVGGVQTGLADALVNLDGKPAHILFLNSSQVAQFSGAAQGLRAAIKKWCPKTCTIQKSEDFATQDWGGPKLTATVTSDLQANPKINTVIVTFDGMTAGIVSAVRSAATTHPGLAMYAWGGGLAEVKAVQNGGNFVGDAGPNEKWDAYGSLDQVIRLLANEPPVPVEREVAPNIYFTKQNAALFSVGGHGKDYSDRAYSNGAFIDHFLKLWEVKR